MYDLEWKQRSIKKRSTLSLGEIRSLQSRDSFLVGEFQNHPWLKISPVLDLWLMKKDYLKSIEDRQRDTNSLLISDFHQSLVAENYNFLAGVYACELRQ